MIKLISCRFVPVLARNPGNAMACSILIAYLLATEQVEVVGASRAEVKSERAVNSKQVSVQPRPSAVNVSYVTLPAFAAAHCAAASLLLSAGAC